MNPTNPIYVELDSSQYFQAMMVGVMRCCENRKKGRKHTHGAPPGQAEAYHIRGAVGEAILAKHLGIFWLGTGVFGGDDVGGYQVRATQYDQPRLCLHYSDIDDKPYVCIQVVEGRGWIYGWLYAKDGKEERHYGDPFNTKRPAFWVPHNELLPMDQLPEVEASLPPWVRA
jgi:hypothetical protein